MIIIDNKIEQSLTIIIIDKHDDIIDNESNMNQINTGNPIMTTSR